MFLKLAARDLAIVAVALLFWRYAAPRSAGDGALSDVLGVTAGFALGACAYVSHEWGHLLGALAGGSAVAAPARLGSLYLFSFDSRRNSRRQFLLMSLGGFLVTGAAVYLTQMQLPEGQLATRVARGLVLFLASLTVFIEFPLVLWSLLLPSLPPVETFPVERGEPGVSA